MNTYYLYRCLKTGRVILDSLMPEGATAIRTLQAEDYGAARAQIDDLEFEHRPGHGWF